MKFGGRDGRHFILTTTVRDRWSFCLWEASRTPRKEPPLHTLPQNFAFLVTFSFRSVWFASFFFFCDVILLTFFLFLVHTLVVNLTFNFFFFYRLEPYQSKKKKVVSCAVYCSSFFFFLRCVSAFSCSNHLFLQCLCCRPCLTFHRRLLRLSLASIITVKKKKEETVPQYK